MPAFTALVFLPVVTIQSDVKSCGLYFSVVMNCAARGSYNKPFLKVLLSWDFITAAGHINEQRTKGWRGMDRRSSLLYVEALHGFKDHTSAKMESES